MLQAGDNVIITSKRDVEWLYFQLIAVTPDPKPLPIQLNYYLVTNFCVEIYSNVAVLFPKCADTRRIY
jgi:hypothetical protein